MSYEFSEDGLIEQALEDTLKEIGWKVVTAWGNETFGKSGLPDHDNKSELVCSKG